MGPRLAKLNDQLQGSIEDSFLVGGVEGRQRGLLVRVYVGNNGGQLQFGRDNVPGMLKLWLMVCRSG